VASLITISISVSSCHTEKNCRLIDTPQAVRWQCVNKSDELRSGCDHPAANARRSCRERNRSRSVARSAVYQGGIKQYASGAVLSHMDGDRSRSAVEAALSNPQLMNKSLLRNCRTNSGVRGSRHVSMIRAVGRGPRGTSGTVSQREGRLSMVALSTRPLTSGWQNSTGRRETETAPVRLGAKMAGISTCKCEGLRGPNALRCECLNCYGLERGKRCWFSCCRRRISLR
jgi:hypothetical protein